jgi:hypothetical protein
MGYVLVHVQLTLPLLIQITVSAIKALHHMEHNVLTVKPQHKSFPSAKQQQIVPKVSLITEEYVTVADSCSMVFAFHLAQYTQ